MSEIADTIRAIRARFRMNTTQFGVVVGVNQSQISRYELGKAMPGLGPLSRLLRLALGAEKNPFLDQLAKLWGCQKGELTESAALEEFQKMGCPSEPFWAMLRYLPPSQERGPTWWEFEYEQRMPNLADFVQAVDELCNRQREIDSSLVQILRFWLGHDTSDAAVRECFADAARYLYVALTAKTHRGPAAPRTATKKLP